MRFKLLTLTTLLLAPYLAYAAELRLAWVGNAGDDDYDRALPGVRLGVDEAALQGSFLDYKVSLRQYQSPSELEQGHDAMAVITDLGGDELEKILRKNPKVPVFYVGSGNHELMPAQCADNLLIVLPPPAILEAAASAWREAKPDKEAGTAAAWHRDFVKFAARDLNKRYKAEFNNYMSPEAWAGWAAVKAIVTAYGNKDEQAVLSLAVPGQRTSTGFDGQKGRNMAFREDGMLPQLVLMITANDKLMGEAPGVWPGEEHMSTCSGH